MPLLAQGSSIKVAQPLGQLCEKDLRVRKGRLKAARDHIEMKITNLVVKVRVEKMLEGLS